MSYNGRLLVRVTSAGGAFPVEGAIVRVEGRSREVDGLLRALVTDRDGQTEILSIPAPDPALSLSPGASAPPYSTLDVFVNGQGFYGKRVFSVSVFAGEETVLPINLIPLSEYNAGEGAPEGTQDVLSGENPALS